MTNPMKDSDEWLYTVLADYSNDLAALKKRNGKLPAEAAIERIQAHYQPQPLERLKKNFEANLLDGDAVQPGQMLAATEVWEYLQEVVFLREQAARLEEVTRMSNDEVWPMTLSLWEYQKLRIKELKQLAAERERNEE